MMWLVKRLMALLGRPRPGDTFGRYMGESRERAARDRFESVQDFEGYRYGPKERRWL